MKESQKQRIISGVPQGMVIGPILFLILINNIYEFIKKDIVNTDSFADDICLTAKIRNEEDVKKFQVKIVKVNDWEKISNMKFNSDKFELVRYRTDCILHPRSRRYCGEKDNSQGSRNPNVTRLDLHQQPV